MSWIFSTEFFLQLFVTMGHLLALDVTFRGPRLVALDLSQIFYHGFPMHAITYIARYVLRGT